MAESQTTTNAAQESCPFCKYSDISTAYWNGGAWRVICAQCNAEGPNALTEQAANELWNNSRVSASVAPAVDKDRETVNRSQLLATLREGMEACLRNANDQTRPEAYRVMMEHFAEAGRQVIEMIEEGRYSGPISAHVCEGCGKPTIVVQVTDDDVVLCPLCYAATPQTAPNDRIQCPHCRWRPSVSLRSLDGLYKCANCDFKWTVPDAPASTVVLHADKLEEFKKLTQGWDSYNAVPIDTHAIEIATLLSPILAEWQIVPRSDGMIQFEKSGVEISIDIASPADI